MLKTPLNKVDEFASFNDTMRTWVRVNQEILPAVLAGLGKEQSETLKSLLRTKRVALKEPVATTPAEGSDGQPNGAPMVAEPEPVDEGANTTTESGAVVARKFFKAKRRVPQNTNGKKH